MRVTAEIRIINKGYTSFQTYSRDFEIGGYSDGLDQCLEKFDGMDNVKMHLALALAQAQAFINRTVECITPEMLIEMIQRKAMETKVAEEVTAERDEARRERDSLKLENAEQKQSLAQYECEMRGMVRQARRNEESVPNKSGIPEGGELLNEIDGVDTEQED